MQEPAVRYFGTNRRPEHGAHTITNSLGDDQGGSMTRQEAVRVSKHAWTARQNFAN